MTTVTRRLLLLAVTTAALLAAPIPSVRAQDAPQPAAAAAADTNSEEDELNVTAGRMEVLLDGKTIELTDNVRFEDSTMILTASRMMIFLDDTPQQTDKDTKTDKAPKKGEDKQREKPEGDAAQDMRLKRIEAYTNVILRKRLDPTESVMGDNAVYDAHRDIVTLTGNCVVTQQGRTLKGKEVVFDRANSKINVQDVIFNLRLPKGSKRSLNGLFGDDKDKDKDKDSQAERGGKDKDKPQP